jgi:P27 family predicted phage terminase small subunit
MPGPAPKPSALKLVAGNPGKRALNRAEPDPDYLDDLTAPAHLPPHIAAVWDELAPKLRKSRLLTTVDTIALELTCTAVANHRLAIDQAGTKMITHNEETGSLSLSPWMILQSMTFKQAMGALAKFGMSPADRSRVISNPQSDLFGNDPADAYFDK